MNMHCWPNTNSKKVCEVVFARIQVRTGYEDAGKGHYDMRKICREWNVMALPPQYRPLFFKRVVVVLCLRVMDKEKGD